MYNPIVDKSFDFAVMIVNLARTIRSRNEYELAGQILRSGTSIGANVAESQRTQSKKDFLSKMHIAAKETNETEYWLRLLHVTNIITDEEYRSVCDDINEIIKILKSITATTQSNIMQQNKQ